MAYAAHGMASDRGDSAYSRYPSTLFLQERIQDLCAKALSASDPECQEVLRELRNPLHEHSETLRKLAAEKLGNT